MRRLILHWTRTIQAMEQGKQHTVTTLNSANLTADLRFLGIRSKGASTGDYPGCNPDSPRRCDS